MLFASFLPQYNEKTVSVVRSKNERGRSANMEAGKKSGVSRSSHQND